MYEFNGMLYMETAEGLLTPDKALARMSYKIDAYNGPFLAGKAPEPPHTYGPLPDNSDELPTDWTRNDDLKVIGDLKSSLGNVAPILIAVGDEMDEATHLASKMGYRPATAGEFIQLLCWALDNHNHESTLLGWHYCNVGRKPKYAILARVNMGKIKVIFDTYLPRTDSVDSNSDNNFYFIHE